MTFSRLALLALLASFLTGMMVFRPTPEVGEGSKREQSDQPATYLAGAASPVPSVPSPNNQPENDPVGSTSPTSYETKLPALSKTAVYAKVNPAVVMLMADREIGSGSIIQPDGLVITNSHVVRVGRRRQERQIRVRLADGREYSGRTVARDRRNDLALIQLDSKDSLPTVPLASATTTVQSGEVVYAIGSPFGRLGVMTEGNLTRILDNGDLQSTVLLKAGNSGGPLLNRQGEMIGVNKGILELRKGVHAGVSFATSLQTVQTFLEQYRSGNGRE